MWRRALHSWATPLLDSEPLSTVLSCQMITDLSVQFTQLCPTLCDPMDCSTPGFPVHHQLLELAQTHGHRVGETIHPTISSSVVPFSSCLHSFPAPGSFPRSQFFTSGGQSIKDLYLISNQFISSWLQSILYSMNELLMINCFYSSAYNFSKTYHCP